MAYDPNKKRDEASLAQRLGAGASTIADGVRNLRDNALFRPVRAIAGDEPLANAARAVSEFGASYSAGRPTAAAPATPSSVARPAQPAPVRNPVVSTVGGGGSTPTGGVPASPQRPPDFSGVRGTAVVPPSAQPTGIQRTMVNGVPTFTGTGAYAPQQGTQPAYSSAVARPALAAPTIAPAGSIGVTNQSESVDQRRAREAAISEIGSQLFQLRGHTTRSARDATGDLLKTQADLTNTAGNQAVALKNNNLDQQVRADSLSLQQNAENQRALVGEQGANARAALSDAGETERAQLSLSRPEYVTDAAGNYQAVTNGVARPVTSDGKPLKAATTKAEGQITPQVQLESLTKELEAAQQSLTPDPARVSTLQAQVDALRGGNSQAVQAPSAGATATNPKTGERVVYRNGKWEPIK